MLTDSNGRWAGLQHEPVTRVQVPKTPEMFLGKEGGANAHGDGTARSRGRTDPRVDQNQIESKGWVHMGSEDIHRFGILRPTQE